MKRLFKRLFIFMIPAIIFISLPSFVLFYTGESLIDIDKIINSDANYIMGLAYSDITNEFKFLTLLKRNKYNTIAIGSSRVMQFRKEMFLTSFYNVGGVAQYLPDYQDFLEKLPKDKLPDNLIIGLDQWMFNTEYNNSEYRKGLKKNDYNNLPAISESRKNILNNISNCIKDYYHGKFQVKDLLTKERSKSFGLNAFKNNNGFRNDGSYQNSSLMEKLISGDSTLTDFNYRNTKKRIKEGISRFEYGEFIDTFSLSLIDTLLNFCKKNNIKVIGFLPPFADNVYKTMIQTNKYKYIQGIETPLKNIFNKYKFDIYNFPTVESCGSSDDETLDGFHGGESTYIKLLIRMADSSLTLNNLVDKKRLSYSLSKRINRYQIYEY